VTLGSCDSSRIARPGRSAALRFGLLLGLLGAAVGLAVGCVDQPLFPVDEPAATGGGSTSSSPGNGGSGNGGLSNGGLSNGGSGTSGAARGGSTNGTGSGGWFGTGGNSQTTGGIGGGGNCVGKVGLQCNAQDECCLSKGLKCGTDGTCCRVENQTCTISNECCSNNCVNGSCAASGASLCLVANYTDRCTIGSCCSAKCDFFDGGATKVCQAIEGCKPVGEQCQNWYECCSDDCNKDTGRCVYRNAPFCQKSGDTCASDSAGQETCCNGLACVAGPEGVLRCAPPACVLASGRCRVASDCCPIAREATGHCVFDIKGPATFDPTGNYGTCGTCGDAGQFCKVELDCCVGFTCLGKETGGGLCVAKTTT
jgi:hypothetical protein